jgi:hypothetical protein
LENTTLADLVSGSRAKKAGVKAAAAVGKKH